jgi:hypothetical protein
MLLAQIATNPNCHCGIHTNRRAGNDDSLRVLYLPKHCENRNALQLFRRFRNPSHFSGSVGFLLVGWKGVVAFFVGRLLAGIVNGVFNWREASYYHSVIGDAFTASEVNFINAYRLHASKLSVTTDVSVSNDEMIQDNWYPAFVALTMKWPEVTERFTYD